MVGGLEHYEKQGCPEDIRLLDEDKVTYAVLIAILDFPCSHIYTDHENVILAFSGEPYPVWVWVKDPEQTSKVDCVAGCLKEAFPLEKGYTYNISHALWNKLKEKDSYFAAAGLKMNLLSYQLKELKPIGYDRTTGQAQLCVEEDLPLLVTCWHDMSMEMEGFDHTEAFCRKQVLAHIQNKELFCWRNEEGEITALTSRNNSGAYCKVAAVYTLPQHRRKGYAIRLVRYVTETILRDGLIPILYTNREYAASNDCYRKIGYEEVGSLCTVESL